KEKLWTNHERESAQARAFSEKEEYILPARFDDTQIPGILPTVGYINLNDYTPREFAELISQKIGHPAQTENRPPEEHPQPKIKTTTIILIISPDGNPLFIDALRVELDDITRLSLIPSSPKEAAFLAGLRNIGEKLIMVAFGLTALFAKVTSVSQIVDGTIEVWKLELRPTKADYQGGGLGEMAYNNLSADDIAEMRAQRILLNEKPSGDGASNRSDLSTLNDLMLEAFVQGINTPIKVEDSPFPALYKVGRDNSSEFLAAARLYAVMRLVLSGTVEHILQLDLRMTGEGRLAVKFEGRRARRYVNRPPHVIRIEGECDLLTEI
ncbi:MAG: hypothetical protein MOB07_02215, partial [Acidobacteria bacterium]|nr:hypothetical protein [Acidobacteriota bacterium]